MGTYGAAEGPKGAAGTQAMPRQPSSWKSIGTLAFVPSFAFVVLVFSFASLYFMAHILVWAVMAVCFSASILFMLVSGFNRQGPMYLHLGVLMLFATVAGCVVGECVYSLFFMSYWRAGTLGAHFNVLPTEPAAVNEDAGELSFSMSSRVDITKTVGYKDNSVYCVAPILDDTQAAQVQFWAAGVNCCEPRSNFRCDDVEDASARSGVVIPPGTGGMFLTPTHEKFQAAAQEAAAAYGLETPQDPIFVRWLLDPRVYEEKTLKMGLIVLAIACGVHFVVNLLLGLCLGSYSKKK